MRKPERMIHNAPIKEITTVAMMPARISMGKIIAGDCLRCWCRRNQRCRSHNSRFHPERAIAGGWSQGKNSKYESHILSCQGTKIEIDSKIFSIKSFAKCPEVMNNSIGKLIVHAEKNAARSGFILTVNDCLEMIARLNFERWINAADVSIENILWSS